MFAWRNAGLPFLVFVLALLPRLIGLATRPFWLDEVFTLQRASLPPRALVQDAFLNHHMPSFFLLLSPLTALGAPQFWLRLPSAVFGALAVMLVFVITRRVAGRRAGGIAVLVIGLSPTALAFSQEARSYTLEMCLILVALYGLLGLALDLAGASRRWGESTMRLSWGLFVAGSAAALDVLGDGLPWLLTANLAALFLIWKSPARGLFLRNLVLADLAVGLLSAPLYALMTAYQGQGYIDSVMWIPPLNAARLWYNIGSVYFMRVADSVTFNFMPVPTPAPLTWLIDAALLVSVLTAFWRLRRRPPLLALLAAALLFLPVLFTLVSLWRPILLPRYILWSAAPFAILAGIGMSALIEIFAPRLRGAALAGVALLLVANMVPYYQAETKPRWDVAAKMLADDVVPGDVVYLYDTGALPILKMYLPPAAQPAVLGDAAGDLAHAQAAVSQGKRVWAVYGHAGQSGNNKEWQNFFAKNRVLGPPRIMQVAGKRIYIALYAAQPDTGVAMNCSPPADGGEGCS